MPKQYVPKQKDLPDKYTTGFMQTLDGRTELGKRLGYSFNSIVSDCGGELASLSYTKRALIERFCFLEEFLRQIELELVKGPVKQADLLGKWIQGSNALLGLSRTLGLGDKSKQDFIDALYTDDPNEQPESPFRTPTAQSEKPKTKSSVSMPENECDD